MLADLVPLMTEQVQHMFPAERDLYGNIVAGTGSTHNARVTYTPGVQIGAASKSNRVEAAATIWLFDHPRAIRIGDVFKLADGTSLSAIRIERRALGGACLSKVFCNE